MKDNEISAILLEKAIWDEISSDVVYNSVDNAWRRFFCGWMK